MLTSIQVYDAIGRLSRTLSLPGAGSASSFFVKEIEGLGPAPATLVRSGYATQDGTVYHSSKVQERNIVLKLGIRPNWALDETVENLREELYGIFPPKAEIRLRFYREGKPSVDIMGIVETHVPVIFSKEPEVQISILCPYPYFNATTSTIINGFVNAPIFPALPRQGATGFLFEVMVSRTINKVTLRNGIHKDIVYDGELLAGDVLKISTVRNFKYIHRTRGASVVNVLDGLTSGSLNMEAGPLTESVTAIVTGAADIPTRLTLTQKYIGI